MTPAESAVNGISSIMASIDALVRFGFHVDRVDVPMQRQ